MFTLLPQVCDDEKMIPIYKPKEPNFVFLGEFRNSALPVVIFIHGDSFDWGSGNLYEGSLMAAFSNIIVVTINYRLGALGTFVLLS